MESSADEKGTLSQKRKRTLDDQVCRVCGDQSTGKHYGIYACDGCSGFYKRTSRRTDWVWVCKSQGTCDVDKNSRNECKACRLDKCVGAGMSMEGVVRRCSKPVGSGAYDDSTSIATSINSQGPQDYQKNTNSTEDHGYNVECVSTIHRPLSALNSPLNASTVIVKTEEKPDQQSHHQSAALPSLQAKMRLISSPVEQPGTSLEHQTNILSSSSSERQKFTKFVNDSSPRASAKVSNTLTQARNKVVTTAHAHNTQKNPLTFNGTSTARAESKWCSVHDLVKAVEPVHFHSTENIQDAAMRLMTASIRFARNLPSFTRLPFRDQIILLEESWKKLFLLDAAYWALPLEIVSLLNVAMGDAAGRENATEIRTVQELLTHLRSFRIDISELACLKGIVIFRPETKGLKDAETVDQIQDDIQLSLANHVTYLHPNHPTRFGKLLLSLLPVQSLAEKPIEQIFFRIPNDKDIFETLLSKLIDS